ncbi:MAG TPA: protease complex subunit PrcB family protein [Clostridia bacterium]|nr:protease complex subunit PrcB family protein [Clostridia bacterium]HHY06133.1 protease complex subunit PrcB family protein [Clostridia bacterium]
MKKKAFILLSVCMAFLVFASFAQAGSKLKLFVNGKNIESDVPVQIIQNRVMAPVRAIAEALGGRVTWDEQKGAVYVEVQEAFRMAKLEEALAPATPLETVKLWAQGVKTRNGALQYAMLSAELREKTYQDYASCHWHTGTSSPWVEDFAIKEISFTAQNQHIYQMEFKLATSTGPAGTGRQKITVSLEGEKWVIIKQEPWLEQEDEEDVKPEEKRGSIVKQVPYQTVTYAQLPAQVQALVDKAKYNQTTQVIKGEGDNRYVLLCLGTRNTGGYSIEISRVEEADGKILVTYQEKKPAPGEMVIQVITYPWQVLQVESSLPIIVREEVQVE